MLVCFLESNGFDVKYHRPLIRAMPRKECFFMLEWAGGASKRSAAASAANNLSAWNASMPVDNRPVSKLVINLIQIIFPFRNQGGSGCPEDIIALSDPPSALLIVQRQANRLRPSAEFRLDDYKSNEPIEMMRFCVEVTRLNHQYA
jgi:hypothetical protein